MTFENPKLKLSAQMEAEGQVSWKSPSNIALIKYWGKHGQQLPNNSSLSFTLENAHTNMHVSYQRNTGPDDQIHLEFLFEGRENEVFRLRMLRTLENLTSYFPFLPALQLKMESSNSFPHSAGIASSASAMSALALCLCSIENELFNSLEDPDQFHQKASYIARLGSGSACRSIYEKVAIWGVHPAVSGSSDEWAIPYFHKVNPIFHSFCDTILIASKAEKSVSSTAGHALMETNIFADTRYHQARSNMVDLLTAMEERDLEKFGEVVENEALSLHALMMTSSPPYILMNPNSLHIIQKIWDYRKGSHLPLYFTLDAGPNIHLLYPKDIRDEVGIFIQTELKQHCEAGTIIKDQVGNGPVLIVNQDV